MKKLLNFLRLYFIHGRNSKKALSVACICLLCSLTIISSTVYYFDNSKKSLMDEFFSSTSEYNNSDSYYSNDIFISFNKLPPYNGNLTQSAIQQISILQQQFNINFFKFVTGLETISDLSLPVIYPNANYSIPIQILQLDSNLFSELTLINNVTSLIKNSYLPNQSSDIPEVYVLYFKSSSQDITPSLPLNNSIIQMEDCCGINKINYPLKVTGFSFINADYTNFTTIKELNDKYDITSKLLLFTPDLGKFANYLQSVKNSFPNIISNLYTFNYVITINFDYLKIDPYNIDPLILTVRQFTNKVATRFYSYFSNEILNLYIDFRTVTLFQTVSSISTNILFSILLVCLPVLIASLFLIDYSFGLVIISILREIGNFKTRGASSKLIFSFQFIDLLLVFVIAGGLSLLTGIPIMTLSLQSNFLFSFGYPAPSFYILNFEATATILFYSSILVSFLVNTRRLKKLSLISINQIENHKDQSEPIWKKYYLDLFLLLSSSIVYIALFIFIKNQGQTESTNSIFNELIILILPVPLALVLGVLLFLSRIIPGIYEKIGIYLWMKQGNTFSFAFKNIIRFKEVSRRAIFLISILITFLIFFYSLPFSFVVNNNVNLYFQNGADAVGTFQKGYNTSDLSILDKQFSSYLNSYSPYIILNTQDSISKSTFAFMLVNLSTYLQTAYLNFDLGLKRQINTDFTDLKNLNETNENNLNVLIDHTSLINGKSSIGNDITVFGPNKSISLHIVDSFQNWPLLQYENIGVNTFVIGDINFFLQGLHKSTFDSAFTRVSDEGILFNFKGSVNQTLVSSWIEGNTSISIKGLTSLAQNQYISGIQFRTMIGEINNNVIMTIIISIIVLILFSYLLEEERKRELILMRAFGMKQIQFTTLFLLETSILILSSIIIGFVSGLLLTQIIILLLFNPLQSYPPFVLVLPVNIILITFLLIFLSCVVFSFIPSYLVSKQEINVTFGEN